MKKKKITNAGCGAHYLAKGIAAESESKTERVFSLSTAALFFFESLHQLYCFFGTVKGHCHAHTSFVASIKLS